MFIVLGVLGAVILMGQTGEKPSKAEFSKSDRDARLRPRERLRPFFGAARTPDSNLLFDVEKPQGGECPARDASQTTGQTPPVHVSRASALGSVRQARGSDPRETAGTSGGEESLGGERSPWKE
jgi:hypothetical protein